MGASGSMGMGPSGSMGMSPSGTKGVGNTPSPSHPYLLQSPPQSGTFAAPIPNPPLISIFSPGTPSVRGYTSIPLPSAAPDIDLKKSVEREQERDYHRDKERDMERERDKDLVLTENPFNNSNESSCTTGDTDNGTTFDNKKINSNGSHSSISTNSSETSQNMDDKDGMLALEGLLSLSNY
jgi:hypothetical protein